MNKRDGLNEEHKPKTVERLRINGGHQPERSEQPKGNPPNSGSGVSPQKKK